jgi:RimJ/RimL family protein N-acetyltransferase
MFDRVGDDPDLSPAEVVRRRYLEVHGDHPMTEADDAHVRGGFVPATDEQLDLMAAGRLPLPSYYLSDGTPMVAADHDELARIAGGVDHLHDWFVAFWAEDPAAGEAAWEDYLAGRYAALVDANPLTIRRTARAVELAEQAITRLREDPRDHGARGQLGECIDGVPAVPGLDSLLRRTCPHDRLRGGGPTLRDRLVDAPREEFFTVAPPDLPIRTERLVLRASRPEDAAAFAPAWADPDYARHLLTGTMNAAEVAEVRRRHAVADRDNGRVLGLVVERAGEVVGDLVLFLQGTGWAQAEVGWTSLPQHSGHGYVTEAARALVDLAFDHYAVHRVVATLDARNARSAAVCERLGMRLECDKRADFWSKGEWTPTLEYAVLADEWAARRTT